MEPNEAPTPTVTVTAPTGTHGSYAQGDPVSVAWTASPAVASGEFGVWAVGSSGSWYGGDLVAAHGAAQLHARPDARTCRPAAATRSRSSTGPPPAAAPGRSRSPTALGRSR